MFKSPLIAAVSALKPVLLICIQLTTSVAQKHVYFIFRRCSSINVVFGATSKATSERRMNLRRDLDLRCQKCHVTVKVSAMSLFDKQLSTRF